MNTILVVDDEAIVCQGIKEFLEASELKISQVLTAWNGYEALDYLRMESIDLVLTDIQMDGMNGIELMGAILAEKPDIPVIAISAHDEFEYAQKCIRLGARDYLIKPVHLEQLLQVVGRALSERHENVARFMEDSLRLKYSVSEISSLRTYFLNEVINGGLASPEDVQFISEQIGFSLQGPQFSVLVIDLLWEGSRFRKESVRALRDRNLFKYAAMNILDETLLDWHAISFCERGSRIVAILQEKKSDDESSPKLNLIGRMVVNNLEKFLGVEAIIGISAPRQGIQALPDCYRQASDAVKWHDFNDNNHVYYAEDYVNRAATLRTDWQVKADLFIEWLRTGKKTDQARETVMRFILDISSVFEPHDASAGIPLSIAYRVYAVLLDRKETLARRYQELDPVVFFRFPLRGAEIKKRLAEFLLEAVQLVHDSMIAHDRGIVQQSIGYIRRNYRNKGLKIQDVADDVHVSPNYVSYLFKQITNETVWEFVTRMRMEESKQLLANTSKRLYEIADEVGYESPEHFSRVFKRYYGESPNTVRG